MLSCRELVHNHASDYLDHQLHGRQKMGVALHLLLCGHCRHFMKKMKLVRKVLARRVEPVDEPVVKNLAEKLQQLHVEQISPDKTP